MPNGKDLPPLFNFTEHGKRHSSGEFTIELNSPFGDH